MRCFYLGPRPGRWVNYAREGEKGGNARLRDRHTGLQDQRTDIVKTATFYSVRRILRPLF